MKKGNPKENQSGDEKDTKPADPRPYSYEDVPPPDIYARGVSGKCSHDELEKKVRPQSHSQPHGSGGSQDKKKDDADAKSSEDWEGGGSRPPEEGQESIVKDKEEKKNASGKRRAA